MAAETTKRRNESRVKALWSWFWTWFCAVPRGRYLFPLCAVVWTELVYNVSKWIAGDWTHYDYTLRVDVLTPFLPFTALIYISSFCFWAVVYMAYTHEERELAYRFFGADILGKGVCMIFFILLPTTNVRPSVEIDGLWDFLIAVVYRCDDPTNLFPSIHCLNSWLCFRGVYASPRSSRGAKWAAFLATAAICVSTLTTKQHVIVDVFGGIAVAELCYWVTRTRAFLRLYGKPADRLAAIPLP